MHNKKIAARIVTTLLFLALAACGGGGLSTPTPDPLTVDGLLAGTITRNGGVQNALAFVQGGRFMAVDAGGVAYDGPFTLTSGQLGGSGLRVYAGDTGRPFVRAVSASGSWSGRVDLSRGWAGTITTGSETIAFDLGYDRAAHAQDSSLSFTQGTWRYANGAFVSILTVDAAGNTGTNNTDNGTATNCNSSGGVALLNPDFNTYRVHARVAGTGCDPAFAGDYSGFALLAQASAPLDSLLVLQAKTDFFIAYRSYQRQ